MLLRRLASGCLRCLELRVLRTPLIHTLSAGHVGYTGYRFSTCSLVLDPVGTGTRSGRPVVFLTCFLPALLITAIAN